MDSRPAAIPLEWREQNKITNEVKLKIVKINLQSSIPISYNPALIAEATSATA
jgi:hypothetical protein